MEHDQAVVLHDLVWQICQVQMPYIMQHTCIVTLSFIHFSFTAVLKTWLPFLIVLIIVGVIVGCSVGITHS